MNREQILDNILETYMKKVNGGMCAIEQLAEDSPYLERLIDNVLVLYPIGYELRSLILQTHDVNRIGEWSGFCYLYYRTMENMRAKLSSRERKECDLLVKIAKQAELEAERAIEILQKAKE